MVIPESAALVDRPLPTDHVTSREHAEGYVAMVCFKHGPPRLTGVELEWTLHDRHHPQRELSAPRLADALGLHAPRTLDAASPHLPLARGSVVTVEPGGQVEISTLPADSLARLLASTHEDAAALNLLLHRADLTLGETGLDPHRSPTRILHTLRYDAMQAFFEPIGDYGIQMMSSTAGIQVCVDADVAGAGRWQALHCLGPALVALFANSRHDVYGDTGWASARMRATLSTSPPTSSAPARCADPAADYARRALDAPLVCVKDAGSWVAPTAMTFADWVNTGRRADAGPLGRPPTYDDLDYHLTTLFPPVRPHGYYEVRYLDAQPAGEWVVPVALLSSLVADPVNLGEALAACEPVEECWMEAARLGASHPLLARAAAAVADAGCRAVEGANLTPALTRTITDLVQYRLHGRAPGGAAHDRRVATVAAH
ncbi:MAG: glutamate-cysteine ligase family protein [Nocardioidaceae bacterium]